ncbi:uncharacterized protein LOC143298332 isoform X2 [Babylonia areolata]|uniref:uncharacterized protein LOC143298332 isoform X2 n=1 Tax=Babylonia areolata TaxID=304850 RepID=UPI003FCFFBB8
MAEVKAGTQQRGHPHRYPPPDSGGRGEMRAGVGYGAAEGVGVGRAEEALRVAAGAGHAERVMELLQAGAELDTDQEGRTALHYAAHNGHPELCRLLINHGCALDTQDSGGYTAVQRACSQGQVEAVEVCVEGGCSINVADQHGNTALHEAAWHGYSQSVQLLLHHHANLFATNKSGFTALHLAAQNGHNESSRVLLYGGIDPDLQNNYGDTALHTAARYGHAGVTRILISAKCQLNLQNKNGDTVLHIAAALKRRKIAKILVESHADVHIHNKQHERAVDVARRKDNPEIVLIINSLARSHAGGGRGPEAVGVTWGEEVEVEDGPGVCAEEEPPAKPDKERGFFAFFKKKKKDKDKEGGKDKAAKQTAKKNFTSTSAGTQGPAPPPSGPPQPIRKVSGFFSHYMPRTGTQYYRDLAGNIKQGPVGYTPVCQCRPVLQHIEQTMEDARKQLYGHIDASHQVLQDRIEQLDVQMSQQAHTLDPGTRQRLEAERRACQAALDNRLQHERQAAQRLVQSFGQELHSQMMQGWLEDRLSSYGHCLDHHHDDSALPPNHIFTADDDANHYYYGPNGGRLFRSRSDETLSASDNSGRGRKRHFYESRKAAMEQIRGWKVPAGGGRKGGASGRRRGERGGHGAEPVDGRDGRERDDQADKAGGGGGGYTGRVITVAADVHHSCDRLADTGSPRPGGGQEGEVRMGGVDRWHQATHQAAPSNRQPFSGTGGRHSPAFETLAPPPAHFLPHAHPAQPPSYPALPHTRQQQQWGASLETGQILPEAQPQHPALHHSTREGGVYERSRPSSRQRQQPRDREDLAPAHSAPEQNGPGNLVSPGTWNSGQRGSQRPQSVFTGAGPHSRHSVRIPEQQGARRWQHARTRSTEGLLDALDSGGDRQRSRSEERVLDPDTGARHGQQQQHQQRLATTEDRSGYVTDSAMRNTHLYHSDHRRVSNDPGVRASRPSFSQGGLDSGNRDQSLWHSRLNMTQPSPKERTSYAMSHVNSDRNITSNPGYVQQSQSSQRSSSAHHQAWPQSLSQRLSSVQTADPYSANDRTRPKTPSDPDSVPYSQVLMRTDQLPSGEGTRGQGQGQGSSEGGAPPQSEGSEDSPRPLQHFSTFKPLSDRVLLQDTRCTPRTDSPAGRMLDRGAQGREPNVAYRNNPAHSGSARTYGGQLTDVHKSNPSLSQDGELSPREPMSSGHYSVTAACLRHGSLSSYSPVEQGDSKEDSTCSSNQDSGYSSRMMTGLHGQGGRGGGGGGGGGGAGGEGRGLDSNTPSSSFSTDRSLSLGTPSTAGSPYLHLVGHSFSDYVPMGCDSSAQPPSDRPASRAPQTDWQRGDRQPGQQTDYQRGDRQTGQQTDYQRGDRQTGQQTDYQRGDRQTGQQTDYQRGDRQPGQQTDYQRGDRQPGQQTDYQRGDRQQTDWQRGDRPAGQQTGRAVSGPGAQTGPGPSASSVQRQVQSWYHHKLLEAAQRLRHSQQYGQSADDDIYRASSAAGIRFDPVHGSDV